MLARRVVNPVASLHDSHHLRRLRSRHGQFVDAEAEFESFAQAALPGQHGPFYDLRHAQVALHLRGSVPFPGVDAHVGAEVVDPVEIDTGLAQAGQNARDVSDEHAVRTDHEHTLSLEGEPVRVEEIGSTVQSDGRLAGAGTALYDEHARKFGPDDLILLRLDRGHDVAHMTRAGPTERGQERAATHQVGTTVAFEAFDGEHLVVDTEKHFRICREVAAALETQGISPGRPVERLRHRCAPVDDDRLLFRVGNGQTTDVEALAGFPGCGCAVVDAPEYEGLGPQLESGQADHGLVLDDVALEPRLVGAAGSGFDGVLQETGRGAHSFETRVGVLDVTLLGFKLRVRRQS
jgi:hypothetical protein